MTITNPNKSWLNRNVVGLAVNRFLSDFGHEAGTSVLPLFLAAIGAPAAALGLIEGVADGLSSFTKLLGGWLGDRVERRKPWAAGALPSHRRDDRPLRAHRLVAVDPSGSRARMGGAGPEIPAA